MHITKIELENIKSHVNSSFEFSRGTTAITGVNGSGKTTLLEAVAWTLFDLLDYKKDDFVRRGAKKGSVRVTFESGLDEREYIVYRDTGTGYYVYDPRINTRIAEKKEEVCRFLWQHLGVEPGTDLDSLFRRAIGVPQGTFTAIFLESPAERKKAFDKLLKVDEYREGAEKLRETARFIEISLGSVRESIARAAGELAHFERIESEHDAVRQQVVSLAEEQRCLGKQIDEMSVVLKGFSEKEAEFVRIRTELERLVTEIGKSEIILKQAASAVDQAKQAAEIADNARGGHEKHRASLARLSELERERSKRDALRAELAKVEAAIVNVRAEHSRVKDNIEQSHTAQRELAILRPLSDEQRSLEKDLSGLRARQIEANAAAERTRKYEEDLGRLRETYAANQQHIREASAKVGPAADLDAIQGRDAELVRRIATLQATLERDEKFQKEIQNGLCPILSQKCLNLKEGETLEGFVTSQFSEIRSEISVLESEKKTVAETLRASREAEKFTGTLAALTARQHEIQTEGERLKQELAAAAKSSGSAAEIDKKLVEIESRLSELDNPASKVKIFEAEAGREIDLRQKLTEVESNIERLESERKLLSEQLDEYAGLDNTWSEYCASRDESAESHRLFLANEGLAAMLAVRVGEHDLAVENLEKLRSAHAAVEKDHAAAEAGYDREKHQASARGFIDLEKKAVSVRERLGSAQSREGQLSAEIVRLAEVRRAMEAEYKEKDKLERASDLTTFIRETLKEAAPRVARNYVHHVSLEANQTFREITGNAEYTLKWADDYGILLEHNGLDRPFANLSGGEQMAAALSVRLALLKQLTDIRIAFFDEPTTNMDAERRENLAMQMSQIKHFDQLFVISHDDTFEGYADNIVAVEKD